MDIPTGYGTKGKLPDIPTGENIPADVGQLRVELARRDYKPWFCRGRCCALCIPMVATCSDEELGLVC